ncbi:hypothetical protein PSPO01_09736 [Paraphaeosphaeria sporulosa]
MVNCSLKDPAVLVLLTWAAGAGSRSECILAPSIFLQVPSRALFLFPSDVISPDVAKPFHKAHLGRGLNFSRALFFLPHPITRFINSTILHDPLRRALAQQLKVEASVPRLQLLPPRLGPCSSDSRNFSLHRDFSRCNHNNAFLWHLRRNPDLRSLGLFVIYPNSGVCKAWKTYRRQYPRVIATATTTALCMRVRRRDYEQPRLRPRRHHQINSRNPSNESNKAAGTLARSAMLKVCASRVGLHQMYLQIFQRLATDSNNRPEHS